jgi:hypothetical protein
VYGITGNPPGVQASAVGVSRTFNLGSFSDPNPATSWTETVNWGDGSTSSMDLPPGSLVTLNHIYGTSGAFPVYVSVTDNLGGTGGNGFAAKVSVASPITVNSPGTLQGKAGVPKMFKLGSFSDPNPATGWTETINWGDGTSSTLSRPPGPLGKLSHTYASAGSFRVSVTVTDNLGVTGTKAHGVNVKKGPSQAQVALVPNQVNTGRFAAISQSGTLNQSKWAELLDLALSQVSVKKHGSAV